MATTKAAAAEKKGGSVKGKKAEEKKAALVPTPAPEKKKKSKEPMEPVMVEQLNEKGEIELIDQNKFPFAVTCEDCGSVRYVNAAGLKTVTKCKRCAAKGRRKGQSKVRREKAKKYAAVVKDALAQNLFPDKFMKKHGLK